MALLVKTDLDADPPHRGMTCLLLEKTPGAMAEGGIEITRPAAQARLQGHRDRSRCATTATACRRRRARRRGGGRGLPADDRRRRGRPHQHRGARRRRRAARLRARASRTRRSATMGKPIAEHQAIQMKLADMATKLEAARLLTAQRRASASRPASAPTSRRAWRSCSRARPRFEVATEALRIHGGVGYTTECPVERYYRDAPLMIIGEGTNEIQTARHRARAARGAGRSAARWDARSTPRERPSAATSRTSRSATSTSTGPARRSPSPTTICSA